MNQAMLVKASWRIFNGDDGLWNSIYKDKYLSQCSLTDSDYKYPPGSSSTWRSVGHGAELLRNGLIWCVGDGKTIKFWTDLWVSETLPIIVALPNSHIDIDATMCSFWDNCEWNLDMLSLCLPFHIIQKILCISPGGDGCGPDAQIWGHTSNGCFNVKSAYCSLLEPMEQNQFQWSFIWGIAQKLLLFGNAYVGLILSKIRFNCAGLDGSLPTFTVRLLLVKISNGVAFWFSFVGFYVNGETNLSLKVIFSCLLMPLKSFLMLQMNGLLRKLNSLMWVTLVLICYLG
ncbi:uncharacterized protein LOC121052682 [Rosa chinensis]|uniref:uncharacterized protein LOC121052682 n=1 Tax=Rosa chinensis TaxID=74649 RepID=UPI001AD948F4|nr:uncharacterized protein LOC121052682 [Rosa chinensis]